MDDFLKELGELSKKHNIFIYGCGCCNCLTSVSDGNMVDIANKIDWDESKQQYFIDKGYNK